MRKYVHAKMVSVLGTSRPVASFVPSPTWSWIAFKTGFIRKPDVYLLVGTEFTKPVPEGLA
ncbi:MAG TPA: hypothetical protein VLW86_03090 [Syntrophorhabdales bacterium]|nr:hypothetical protein [Syntrophorhabdales bacterium]